MRETIERAMTQGERARLVPVTRLAEVARELEAFKAQPGLNGFQRWLLDHKFRLEVPALSFPARSILIVAIPRPAYAPVELAWEGRRHRALSLVATDVERTGRDLEAFAAGAGFRVAPAPDVPLKRLAARSGLARYGKNNICFVEGMGSHLAFEAWFTDLPGDEAAWVPLEVAPRCAQCKACQRSCPTGAVRADRFLLDNERCLSFINERADPFPDWLPADVHHCLYDCLLCQLACPMNAEPNRRIGAPVAFDEAETALLLAGTPFEALPPALARKSRYLGLHHLPDGLPKNVRALLAQPGPAARARRRAGEPGGGPR